MTHVHVSNLFPVLSSHELWFSFSPLEVWIFVIVIICGTPFFFPFVCGVGDLGLWALRELGGHAVTNKIVMATHKYVLNHVKWGGNLLVLTGASMFLASFCRLLSFHALGFGHLILKHVDYGYMTLLLGTVWNRRYKVGGFFNPGESYACDEECLSNASCLVDKCLCSPLWYILKFNLYLFSYLIQIKDAPRFGN